MNNKFDKLKTVGVWIDDAFSKINQEYVDKLKECHVNSVGIMVNKSNTTEQDKPWELRTKREDFIKAADMFNKNNIEVSLTCWPQPNKEQIDALIKDMAPLLKETSSKAFEIDSESNWNPKFLKGFKTMKEASEYLVSEMKKVATQQNLKLQLTTFPYHSENSKNALVSQHMDKIFPQAYSVRSRRDGVVSWEDSIGPGKMQELTIKRAKQIPGFKGEFGCGLAAYDQKWPEHTEAEAMEKSLLKAIELGVTSVYFWSSKWVVGSQATTNKPVSIFLKSIR